MATQPGSVIVGYDGSPDAKRALTWAAAYARTREAPVRVVVATGDMRLRQVTELDQEWERSRVAELTADVRAAVAAAGLGEDAVDMVDAGPAPAVIVAADPSSVIVLGSRGHGRIAGALAGSVTQHVTYHAPCTVVVVREQSNPDARRVVVGVDGSEECKPALDFAFAYADRTNAPLTAVHVLHTLAPGPPYASRYVGDRYAGELSKAEPIIDEFLSVHVRKHPGVEVSREIVAGSTGRVLCDASEQAALLVVGSRGRGAFQSLLLGSVGQAVLHNARCPVVIAR
jgi:nucleotide-binding universal stress UspA family protein